MAFKFPIAVYKSSCVDWGHSSMVEHLPSMHNTLGSISGTTENNKGSLWTTSLPTIVRFWNFASLMVIKQKCICGLICIFLTRGDKHLFICHCLCCVFYILCSLFCWAFFYLYFIVSTVIIGGGGNNTCIINNWFHTSDCVFTLWYVFYWFSKF